MKILIIALCAAACLAQPGDEYIELLFSKFKSEHNKVYKTRSEQSHRLQVFAENVKKINKHNQEGHSYKLGINQFTDLTEAEFKSQFLGGYKSLVSPAESQAQVPRKLSTELPESVDWRDKGIISDVKNQGQCGSCWAFATTQIIESYAALATGNLVELSTQQVTSCTPNPVQCGGTGGCYGSIPQLGYTYINLFGHATESDYPYVSGQSMATEECVYDVMNTAPVVGITGYDTMSNDQDAVMEHLANVGPLAVAVDATYWGGYRSGVFDGCSFDENIGLNHAVMLVGYGTDAKDGDYWIVRNSWGSSWGDNGYIKLQRQAKAQCGINSTPMDGTACVGGPGNDQQTVCGQCGVLFDVSYPLGAHEVTP